MAYGQTDEIVKERKARSEVVDLLLAVATQEKTVADIQSWLEDNYPELCYIKTKTKTKKW